MQMTPADSGIKSPGFSKIGLKDEFNVSSYNIIGTAELAELIASLLVLYIFLYLQWFCLLPSGTSNFENETVRLSGIKEQTLFIINNDF